VCALPGGGAAGDEGRARKEGARIGDSLGRGGREPTFSLPVPVPPRLERQGLTGVDPGGPVSCSDPDQDRKSMSRLYFAMLRDCLDDLDALLSGSLKVAGDESLSEEDAHEYLLELIDWFLNEETVSPCSLDTVCVAVSADPVEVRRRVRLVLKREDTPLLKRRRLTPEELRDIRRLVFRQTTPELAENSK
jgi:hypothetical protein